MMHATLQQALTDDTCARVRDRVEPHGHPVARLFPTNLRSGLGRWRLLRFPSRRV